MEEKGDRAELRELLREGGCVGKRGLYDAGKMRGHDDRAGTHVMSAHTVHRTEHPHSHIVTVFSGGQTSGRPSQGF